VAGAMLYRVKRKSVGLFTSMSKLQQQSTKVVAMATVIQSYDEKDVPVSVMSKSCERRACSFC